MSAASTTRSAAPNAREKLLDAAVGLIREQGFAATTVDALCARAGVTKGAFFHHFDSKEALGAATVDHWTATSGARFSADAYHDLPDPLDRVLAYLDLRRRLIAGPTEAFTCVAGTMVQEAYLTSPRLREACANSIWTTAGALEEDIRLALEQRRVWGVGAAGLALHIQAVIQGGFILAKAGGGVAAARDSLDHLERYIRLIFSHPDVIGTHEAGPVDGPPQNQGNVR